MLFIKKPKQSRIYQNIWCGWITLYTVLWHISGIFTVFFFFLQFHTKTFCRLVTRWYTYGNCSAAQFNLWELFSCDFLFQILLVLRTDYQDNVVNCNRVEKDHREMIFLCCLTSCHVRMAFMSCISGRLGVILSCPIRTETDTVHSAARLSEIYWTVWSQTWLCDISLLL